MNICPFSGNIFRYRRENPGRREFRPPPLPRTPSRKEQGGICRGSSTAHRICGALLIASFLWAQTVFADEVLLRGPRKIARQHMETAAPRTGILERIAAAPVLFYQRFLGLSWGRRCTYYPSCSNYALLAIRKHGAVLGSIMAFDRLQHEADEVSFSPLIVSEGEIKGYDPLENNDYWWYTANRPEPVPPPGRRPGGKTLMSRKEIPMKARVKATGITYPDNYLSVGMADLEFTPFPFLDINTGYKVLRVRINHNETFPDYEFTGHTIGLTVSV